MNDEDAPKKIKVDYYVDLVLRRRWLLIISFCLSMIGGIFFSITLPRIYSSDTLILIEPKSIPDKYVEPITETSVQQRVSTITEKVKSRTYLEQIINATKLYSGPGYKNMLLEEKIELVRKKIIVKVTRGRKGADAFKISFEGKEPKKVTQAVNALANYFIDESIKVMEAEVIGAITFLRDELRAKKEKLLEVENKLKEYRMSYMGGLPEQLNSNLGMLTGLREQLGAKQEGLRDEKIRLIQLDGQLTEARRELEGFAPEDIPEDIILPKKSESPNVLYLRQLREQYTNLSNRYTPQHPDIIKLKKLLADAEAKVEKEVDKAASEPQPEIPKKKKVDPIVAKYKAAKEGQIKEIKEQYEEAKRTIKAHQEDIKELAEKIKIYEKRVEETPEREQDLMSIMRDYKNIQDSYNSLLERKLDADIAVSMERKSQGARFKILDKARVPKKPISPNMLFLLAISVSVGIAAGGGLIFLLDLLDTSLRRPEDIEDLMEIPVLATLPNIHYRPIDKVKQRFDQVFSILFIMVDIGLLGAFGILALKGLDFVKERLPGTIVRFLFPA